MIIIPDTEMTPGDSPGKMSQLSMAPATGIRNFQKFNVETLTPGLISNMVQIEMATADNKLNQERER